MKTLYNNSKQGKQKTLKFVMSKAWEFYRNEFITFKDALSKAWEFVKDVFFKRYARPINVNQLLTMLRNGVVKFGYFKLNGEYRIFEGTLQFNNIPHSDNSNTYRHTNIRFYDFRALNPITNQFTGGWRSLANNTKTVYIL